MTHLDDELDSDIVEDEDDELGDNEIWRPEPDLEEDPFVIEAAYKKLYKAKGKVAVRPSQFTEHIFKMPDPLNQENGFSNFTFEGRRHMRRIYDSPAKRMLLFCGRQVEKSTLLGNIGLCYCCLIPAYKVLYVSPSNQQTKTFSNDRIKEPTETSPLLRKFTTSMLSSNILEKQFVNRSKYTLRYAFLNADRTRGIPAHLLQLDEFQDILSDNIPIIEQCLSHAPEQWKRFIYSGTPKSLDNNLEYYRSQHSTQGEWVVPCDFHTPRYWNILGEKNIGKKSLICEKCGNQLDPAHPDAQWASQVKEATFESYRIPQIMVPWKKWDDVISDYERYPRNKFYNEVLGISYDSGLRPLTTSQVQSCCNEDIHMSDAETYRAMSYNSPVFAGVDWGCHDDQTRILTSDGFKYFKDLTLEDTVAQWEPDSRQLSFAKPLAITAKDWDKPLLHFETKGRVDLMVTEDHRMRVLSSGTTWLTEEAGQTAARGGNVEFVGHLSWVGVEQEFFTLPGLSGGPGYAGCEPVTVRMDDWLQFSGYLISEGGLCYRKGKDSLPSCLKMSQRQSVNFPIYTKMKAVVAKVCTSFKEFYNPNTTDSNFTIYGKQYWKWCQDNIGSHGDEKRIPRWMLGLSKRQLHILFEALVEGDGSVDPRANCTGGTYHSTSRALCEDFQELCIRLGLSCWVKLTAKAEGNRKARYTAGWSRGRDYTYNTPSSRVKSVPYSGKVYCCTVPAGYIVTERNGKISYQGNSGEHSYTVVMLATYVGSKFRIFYAHRFVGEDTSPEVQLEKLTQLFKYFNVKYIGSDYGGGFASNDYLVRRFGPRRLFKYQYVARAKKKIEYDGRLGRFKINRTEVMSDIFNSIKRKQCEFPRWDEFKQPYGQDMLNIFSEYNETLKMIQYGHSLDKPDDAFHVLVYVWLASMVYRPRIDIIAPRREDSRGVMENVFAPPGMDQG